MIVCSCNIISDQDLADGIATVRTKHPHRTLTVGLVYKALGKKLNCGGCLPLTMRILSDLNDEGEALAGRSRRRRRPCGATGGSNAGYRMAASPDDN